MTTDAKTESVIAAARAAVEAYYTRPPTEADEAMDALRKALRNLDGVRPQVLP